MAKRLREAGAVILGKTNLSEWANIRSSHSTSGWSGRGGLTRNPYALDRNPCGSSSGSGAAVSANFCALAIGTETDGSIVCPSGVNGIVGIKPTVGLVSRAGIVPIAHSQDTAGPMARTRDRCGDFARRTNRGRRRRSGHRSKPGKGAGGLHPIPRSSWAARFANRRGAQIVRHKRCSGQLDKPSHRRDETPGCGDRGSGRPRIHGPARGVRIPGTPLRTQG